MSRLFCWLGAVVLFMAMITTGCATGISDQAMSQVTYMGTFEELQRQPEKYMGDAVIWGGKVIETKPGEGHTELVVLQLDLGDRDRPQDTDKSRGRFLARSAQFLDPALIPAGTLVTIVGRMQDTEKRLIGQMAYQYPVIDIIEMKKWSADGRASPRFHFGIGVGTRF